jgi:uncharacterized membrane protein YqhA
VNRFLSITRYIIYIPVAGAWLSSLIAMGLGAYEVIFSIISIFLTPGEKTVKLTVLNLVEAVDLFLLGTAFYLIALGLYELFINANAPLPDWLVIHDLDDLKSKLLSVIIVVLAVQFLAQVLGWTGGWEILGFGTAIALVTLALAFFIAQKSKKSKENGLH